jgi:hypothetical protein
VLCTAHMYSNAIGRRRPRQAAADRVTCASDHERPHRQELASRGQGLKSPRLHRVLAGRVALFDFRLSAWEPLWEPGRRLPVWLGLRGGYGEDGIYFDHRGDCRDSALHKTSAGHWRSVISLGFNAGGKRVRRKVSGKTKAEGQGQAQGFALRAGRGAADGSGVHGREGRGQLAGRRAAGTDRGSRHGGRAVSGVIRR